MVGMNEAGFWMKYLAENMNKEMAVKRRKLFLDRN